MRNKYIYIIVAIVMMLSSCASKKTIVDTGVSSVDTSKSDAAVAFVKKTTSNAVETKNITGNMNFTIAMGKKDISVPGSVHMRKDEVIRLQLFIPILGSEVGRLEFTPDYVLVMDRMHKEYIKADYNQLDFLRNNGLTFYSLQALFWNELLIPGKKIVAEGDYASYSVDFGEGKTEYPLTITNGNMTYKWNVGATNALINSALVTYKSRENGNSSLSWKYSDFKKVGTKQFPATQTFTFTTTATGDTKSGTVTIKMSDVKTDSKWDPQTIVSSKYKKIEATDLFTKLMEM